MSQLQHNLDCATILLLTNNYVTMLFSRNFIRRLLVRGILSQVPPVAGILRKTTKRGKQVTFCNLNFNIILYKNIKEYGFENFHSYIYNRTCKCCLGLELHACNFSSLF